MTQNLKNLFLTTLLSMLTISSAFAQRVFDNEDNQPYDWSNFEFENFFYSAVMCAVVIVLGLLLRKNFDNSFFKGLGTTMVVIGSIVAFAELTGPILGAIQIIWQVFIGSAIFFGTIYWVYTNYIE